MPVYAGWEQTGATWKYQNTDKTYMTNTWAWLDGNNDGISECYYFGADGIMLSNVTTADGFLVNADGQWVVNNVVQTKTTTEATVITTDQPETEAPTESSRSSYDDNGKADVGSIAAGILAGDPAAHEAAQDADVGGQAGGNANWN